MEDQLKREIAIMKILKHKHVVGLREVLQSSKHIYIVLELITGGELFDRIVSLKKFDEPTARKFFQQLINGVEYCHAHGIAHRDLKPENLLLDVDDNLKISDFGLSALSTNTGDGRQQLLMTTCGTPNYVAPEVLQEQGYNGFLADIWSCGIILYVMLAGYLPFEDDTMKGLFEKIEKGEFKCPSHFSPEVKDLIQRMLVTDPNRRITLDKIKQHPWFKIGYKEVEQQAAKIDITEDMVKESIKQEKDENLDEKDSSKKEIRNLNAFDLASRLMMGAVNPLISSAAKIRRETIFMANGTMKDLKERFMKELLVMQANPQSKENSNEIKCFTNKNANLLTFVIEISPVAGGFAMVEMRRGKGDILEFNSFYRFFLTKIQDIIINKDSK
jgi:serine/threonine protein kinase